MTEFEIHASAVVIGEAGVLIRGASGSGKSRLALALIAAARGGGAFARLIGDDRIRLESCNERLIGRGHPRILGQIEQRGAGILQAPFIAAAVVRLVVDIVPAEKAPRYPEPAPEHAGFRSQDWDFSGLGDVQLADVRAPLLVAPDTAAATDLARAVLQHFRLAKFSDAAGAASLGV
jgi:serine kinase of HPr protein (carbohydrate metabolism regulator)